MFNDSSSTASGLESPKPLGGPVSSFLRWKWELQRLLWSLVGGTGGNAETSASASQEGPSSAGCVTRNPQDRSRAKRDHFLPLLSCASPSPSPGGHKLCPQTLQVISTPLAFPCTAQAGWESHCWPGHLQALPALFWNERNPQTFPFHFLADACEEKRETDWELDTGRSGWLITPCQRILNQI